MYLSKSSGYSTSGLALENVRMRTSQYNQAGGITETILVDVFDGQLTLSQYLPSGSTSPNWLKIEALASFEHISDEPISWAPTSTNAFWELEMAESEEIGLVVLAPLHTNKVSATWIADFMVCRPFSSVYLCVVKRVLLYCGNHCDLFRHKLTFFFSFLFYER